MDCLCASDCALTPTGMFIIDQFQTTDEDGTMHDSPDEWVRLVMEDLMKTLNNPDRRRRRLWCISWSATSVTR